MLRLPQPSWLWITSFLVVVLHVRASEDCAGGHVVATATDVDYFPWCCVQDSGIAMPAWLASGYDIDNFEGLYVTVSNGTYSWPSSEYLIANDVTFVLERDDGNYYYIKYSSYPADYVAQARANYASLTADQKKDPHRVASLVVDTIATARDDLGLDLKKAWDEYVGLGDEGTPPLIGPGGGGRRPGGLGGRGRGKGDGRGGGGRGRGKGAGDDDERPPRPTKCSVLPPRGPMCNIGHNTPCWRDPDFEGPLPLRVWKNPAAMKDIEADRLKNATRLGTTCKKLNPPPDSPATPEDPH